MGNETVITTITSENFEAEVLTSPIPVLLDFWAEWCGPCRMIGPFIEQLGAKYSGQIKTGKVNVDEQGDLATRHGVVSIPTLILYKNGNIVRRQVGAAPTLQIESMIKEVL
jgi:thioredoxin 1